MVPNSDEDVIHMENVQSCCDCEQVPVIVHLAPEVHFSIDPASLDACCKGEASITMEEKPTGQVSSGKTVKGKDFLTALHKNRKRGRTIRNYGPKPKRNAPCPCGSGLKFKLCCLNRPPIFDLP